MKGQLNCWWKLWTKRRRAADFPLTWMLHILVAVGDSLNAVILGYFVGFEFTRTSGTHFGRTDGYLASTRLLPSKAEALSTARMR